MMCNQCKAELAGKGEGGLFSKKDSSEGEGRENAGIILGSLGAGLGWAGRALTGSKDEVSTPPTPTPSPFSNPLVIGGLAVGGLGVAYLLLKD